MIAALIVNPETIRHVIDRQLRLAAPAALMHEEVQFDENMVTSVDWLTYPVDEDGWRAQVDRDRH